MTGTTTDNAKGLSSMTRSTDGVMIDRGFDAPFSKEQVDSLCSLFGKQPAVADAITAIHEHDGAFDLKRGEFYPELLRAVLTLKKHAASAYGIGTGQVQANYGSNGSIDTILAAVKVEETRRQGTRTLQDGGVLMTSPTYFRNYNSASAKNLQTHFVPLRPDSSFDTEAFVAAMGRIKPSIIILVTPNNPTGMSIPDADLYSVLDNLPLDTWAMVDRTLVNVKPQVKTQDLLQRYAAKNVVILHSYSKYKGMSHLRIGMMLYSNPSMAAKVQPHLPLGIGLEGCLRAVQFLMDEGPLRPSEHISSNIKDNHRILQALAERNLGFGFTDFSGNYCLLRIPEWLPSKKATDLLANSGLFVMGGHEFPEPDNSVVRLHTGGDPKYTEKLCSVLREAARTKLGADK